MSEKRIRIATVQFDHKPVSSFDQFAHQVKHYVRFAHDSAANLVVFPEYLTAPLTMVDPNWDRWTGVYQEMFHDLARETGMMILGGTHLTRVGEKLHNRAHLFMPDGELITQDKVHMTPCEVDPWALGRGNDFKLIETPYGKMAINICFDIEFPGLGQACADAGADIILCPSATDDRQGFWRVRYCCHARAIENQVYVVHSALVGGVPDVRYLEQSYGRSGIITPCDVPFPPDGIMVQGEWNQGTCVVGEVDLDLLRRIREGGSVLPRRERRPEAYKVSQ